MAATDGVWGIDVGQCALKALRCEYDVENKILVATAFDFIEYPKILSQPDADPKVIIREALHQFLERNDVKGDKIAVSVPGQNGLARFFQPPPVDMRKLPDIVQFEARQQIPFPLEEVIWDFQLMGGSSEVEGFLMEAEVGLFAMKRDQVYEALDPFLEKELEIHHIQLSPLCAYNFVSHNLMTEALEADIYDPDNPPESFVILSVGTDTTDLVITNGFRVWQRNIPLGGNHFTKQLTKELKLTFAKAEHLKRNVRDAEDAKAVIQAMRPVFNDLLTEVQRSIGFFQNIDRNAEISGMITLGNAVKLPGLQQYLSKNLGYELVDVDHSSWAARLAGQSVLTSPQFKENMHAFGNCYGLCLQGLGQAKLKTNLLPKEILTERLIRAKKPWALASAAVLMLAFAVNFFFEYANWYTVHDTMKLGEVSWKDAIAQVENVSQELSTNKSEDSGKVGRLGKLVALGKELSGNADRRLLWMELLKAINRALPQDEGVTSAEMIPDPKTLPISQRKELHIEYIESQYFSDLSSWFTPAVKTRWDNEQARLKENPSDASAPAAAPGALPGDMGAAPGLPGGDLAAGDAETAGEGPSGPGWVIEMKGYHFYNEDFQGGAHVRDTLLKNLREQMIELPTAPGQPPERFTMKELGIGYPILTFESRIEEGHRIPNPYYEGIRATGGSGQGPGYGGPGVGLSPSAIGAKPKPETDGEAEEKEPEEPPFYIAPRYDFVVQFCWQEKQLRERLDARQEALQAAAQNNPTSAEPAPAGPDGAAPAPATPAPAGPTPAPAGPAPTGPAPAGPAPTGPAPTEPASTGPDNTGPSGDAAAAAPTGG